MEIKKHLLKADYVTQGSTPNQGGNLIPRYLVFHFTAGRNYQSSVDWLSNPQAKASAHLVIGRDGRITQLVPFNKVAWHAGKSHWDGLTGLNNYSIGIEIDNAGELTKTGNKYLTWFNAEIPAEDVIEARHKQRTTNSFWQTYTPIQIERSLELARLLVQAYGLTDIVGHEDIAPLRKNDPGPAFPLANIRSSSIGRADDQDDVFVVTVDDLNIRKGPGIEFDPVAAPLQKDTRVLLLEARARWSLVDVEGDNDLEGWVNNKFIARVTA